MLWYVLKFFAHTFSEVINVQDFNKKEQEKLQEQKVHNEFNSVTEKVKPENQNQQHNVRREGITPVNQKR